MGKHTVCLSREIRSLGRTKKKAAPFQEEHLWHVKRTISFHCVDVRKYIIFRTMSSHMPPHMTEITLSVTLSRRGWQPWIRHCKDLRPVLSFIVIHILVPVDVYTLLLMSSDRLWTGVVRHPKSQQTFTHWVKVRHISYLYIFICISWDKCLLLVYSEAIKQRLAPK